MAVQDAGADGDNVTVNGQVIDEATRDEAIESLPDRNGVETNSGRSNKPTVPPTETGRGKRFVGHGLLWITVIGLIVRLGWGLSQPADDAALAALPDQAEYLQIGRNILNGQGAAFYDDTFASTLYAYRMPGYPLLIAGCGGKIIIVRAVQGVLGASMIVAVYLLARQLRLSRRTALVAAAFIAINPYLIFFSGLLLSETLFTAMLIWGMCLLISKNRLLYFGGFVLLAGLVFVRPAAGAMAVLLAAVVPLLRSTHAASAIGSVGDKASVTASSHTRNTEFFRLTTGAAMVLLVGLFMGGWAYRNAAVLGRWVLTTTNSGVTLYDGFNDRADGSSSQAFFRNWPELKTMAEAERSDYLNGLATRYIADNPRRAITLTGQKLARLWSPVPLSAEYGQPTYMFVGGSYCVLLFFLTLAGLFFSNSAAVTETTPHDDTAGNGGNKFSRSAKLFLLVPAVVLTIVHALTVGSLRYRVPADVPMTIIAAVGLGVVQRRLVRPSHPSWELPSVD